MRIPYAPGEPLTCQQIRELEILTIEHVGVPSIVLMENAGAAVADFVYHALLNPRHELVIILCGGGNNGGDGFVVARHLGNAGVRVRVVLAAPRDALKGDALANFRVIERMELEIRDAADIGFDAARELLAPADVIVDALLGIGARGAPRGALADLIDAANGLTRCRRIAIDVPSGLDADTGVVHTPCFRAAATVTMTAPKVGFDSPAARGVLGRVIVVDVGAPRALIPGRSD